MGKNNTYEDPWANYTGNLSENRKKAKTALTDAFDADLSAYTEGYNKDVAALEEERSLARQQANINHQLTMKYLPTQMKSMGLHGLGVSQSAITDTLANYQNDLTDIDRTYRTSMDELAKGKTEYEAGLKKNLNSNLLSLYTAQEAEDREDAIRQEGYDREDAIRRETYTREDELLENQRLYDMQNEAYNTAYDLLLDGETFSTYAEAKSYLDEIGVNLREDQNRQLTGIMNLLYRDNVSSVYGPQLVQPPTVTQGLNTEGARTEKFRGGFDVQTSTNSETTSTKDQINLADIEFDNNGKGTVALKDGSNLILHKSYNNWPEEGVKDGQVFNGSKFGQLSGQEYVFLNGQLYQIQYK